MAKQQPQKQQKDKKKPFQVGPKLGKGQYTGHAQRIKRTLIHKAKVKKSYAKALKEAGYEPERPVGRGDKGKGETRQDDPDEGEPVVDEAEKEAERERLRRRLYGDDDASDANEQSDEDGDSEDEGRGRSARFQSQRRRGSDDESDDDGGSPSPSPEPESVPRSRQPLPPQHLAASLASSSSSSRSRQRQPKPAPPKPAKTAPAPPPKPKRPKLSEKEVEALREQRRQEKRAGGQRNARGQAKLADAVRLQQQRQHQQQDDDSLDILQNGHQNPAKAIRVMLDDCARRAQRHAGTATAKALAQLVDAVEGKLAIKDMPQALVLRHPGVADGQSYLQALFDALKQQHYLVTMIDEAVNNAPAQHSISKHHFKLVRMRPY